MVRVVSPRLDDGDDRARIDEPRQVVDVSVRVVALDSAAEPDDVAQHQGNRRRRALDVRAIESRVTRLDLAEQALLGREQRALAVDVDRTALHHDRGVIAPPAPRGASIAAAPATARISGAGGCRDGNCRTWPSR